MIKLNAIFATLSLQGNMGEVQSSDMPDDAFASVLSEAQSSINAEAPAEKTGETTEKTNTKETQDKKTEDDDDTAQNNTSYYYVAIPVIAEMQAADVTVETEESVLEAAPALTEITAEEPVLDNEPESEPVLPEEPVLTDTVTPEDPVMEPPVVPDTQPVTTILESNMDIETPVETGVTARMPQTTGPIDSTEEEPTDKTVKAEGDSPCPLENDNDAVQNTGRFEKPEEESGEKGQENAPKSDETGVFSTQQAVNISPERVSSAERFDSAAGESKVPVTTDKIFDAMVEKIELSQIEGADTLEIQLKPEFLGKVSIQLSLGSSGLEVKIKADDMNVKSLIASQLAALSETLSEKGIKVGEIEVVYSEVADQQFDQSQSKGGGQERHSGRNAVIETFETSALAATSWEDEMGMLIDSSISSVEYRA